VSPYRTPAVSFEAYRIHAFEIAEEANEATLVDMIMNWPPVYAEAARARIKVVVALSLGRDADRKAKCIHHDDPSDVSY